MRRWPRLMGHRRRGFAELCRAGGCRAEELVAAQTLGRLGGRPGRRTPGVLGWSGEGIESAGLRHFWQPWGRLLGEGRRRRSRRGWWRGGESEVQTRQRLHRHLRRRRGGLRGRSRRRHRRRLERNGRGLRRESGGLRRKGRWQRWRWRRRGFAEGLRGWGQCCHRRETSSHRRVASGRLVVHGLYRRCVGRGRDLGHRRRARRSAEGYLLQDR